MATAKAKKSMPGTTVLEFDTGKIAEREREVAKETDAEILERLGERFQLLRGQEVRSRPRSSAPR